MKFVIMILLLFYFKDKKQGWMTTEQMNRCSFSTTEHTESDTDLYDLERMYL